MPSANSIPYFLTRINTRSQPLEARFATLWQDLNYNLNYRYTYSDFKYSTNYRHTEYNAGDFKDLYDSTNGVNTIANYDYFYGLTVSIFNNQIGGIYSYYLPNLFGLNVNNFFSGDANDYIYANDSTSAVLVNSGGGDDNITGTKFGDILFGSLGNDTITGRGGNDTLLGGDGNDTLSGEDGIDTLEGGEGSDNLDGGDGDDTLYGSSSTSSFNSSEMSNQDIIKGGAGNDIIYGGGGKNNLDGGDGNDTIYGGLGDSDLSGGNGDDILQAGSGKVILRGGAGSDTLIGSVQDDTIYTDEEDLKKNIDGGDGFDDLEFGYKTGVKITADYKNIESYHTTEFADEVIVTNIARQVFTGGGADKITTSGSALVDAGDGDDTIFSNSNANNYYPIFAGNGDDSITIGGFSDNYTPYNYTFDNKNSALDGGTGNDTIRFTSSFNVNFNLTRAHIENVFSGSGNDNLTAVGSTVSTMIDAGAGNDNLTGGSAADYLNGGAGNDTFFFNSDRTWEGFDAFNIGSPDAINWNGQRIYIAPRVGTSDVFEGGDGIDTIQMSDASEALFLDDAFSAIPTGQSSTRIKNIEIVNAGGGDDIVDFTSDTKSYGDVTINGDEGDDVLWASAGNDKLNGGTGNDNLDGGTGNDILTGGLGKDTLRGGGGNDIFKFNLLEDSLVTKEINNSDLIMDFHQGEDIIDLSGLGFHGIDNSTHSSDSLNYYHDIDSGNTLITSQDLTFQINVAGNIHFNNGDFIF